jgi:hypothetical protein
MTSASKSSRRSEATARQRHPELSDKVNVNKANGSNKATTLPASTESIDDETIGNRTTQHFSNKCRHANRTSSLSYDSDDDSSDDDRSIRSSNPFLITFEFNLIAWSLFVIAFVMRIWTIDYPRSVVLVAQLFLVTFILKLTYFWSFSLKFRFDELNYGKFISLYMKGVFYFDSQPPLGKQLIACIAYLFDYQGNGTFNAIGSGKLDLWTPTI